MENYIFNTTDEKIDTSELDEVIQFACKKMNIKNPLLNIVIVDNKRIQEINKEYRNKDAVTDVISFAFEDDGEKLYNDIRVLGDIYICIPQMKRQAIDYGHSEKRELSFLTVHGLLHLLGYDHMIKEDEEVMFGLQELILDGANIKR